METLSDFAPLAAFFASGMMPINADSFKGLALQDDELLSALQFALWRLEALRNWQRDDIFTAMKSKDDSMDIKIKNFFAPMFIAISGTAASISVIDSMAILGPDLSRARIRYAIEQLGGVGKKKLKKLEKTYINLV
jgi:glutamyl-tRNA synthetase